MSKFPLLFAALLLFASGAIAQKAKAVDPVYATKAGAIHGYDPVAYFTDGKPVEGLATISLEWRGATWHFASAAHRTLFEQNPEKYAPAYGGYCAYGWAQDKPVKIDPDAWSIVNDTLYLNYSKSVQSLWEKKRTEYIKKADINWQNATKNKN